MYRIILIGTTMVGTAAIAFTLSTASWAEKGIESGKNYNQSENIQLGPRPFYLINDMDNGALKKKLESCETGPFKRTDFSIGHRGAPL